MSSYWNHERTWLHHTPYSRLVGAVLGDSDVSTSAAWSTGHSAIHPLVTRGGPLHLCKVCILPCEWVAPLDGQASWVNLCVRTL